MKCLLCKRDTVPKMHLPHISHQPVGSRSFTIRWCAECDFGILDPRPSAAELANYYGTDYFSSYGRQDASSAAQAQSRPFVRKLVEHLAWRCDRSAGRDIGVLRTIAKSSDATALDVGCGNGDLLLTLKGLGYKVVGVEPDAAAVATARARGLDIHVGTAESLPTELRKQRFDVVTMTQVLEHCLDPCAALQNVRELLCPSGALLLHVPNCEAYAARQFGPAWFHCDAGRHVNYFTGRSLQTIARINGFQPVTLLYWAYTSQFTEVRLESGQKTWDLLYKDAPGPRTGWPPRNDTAQLVRTFLRTCLAPANTKYELVGLLAKKVDRHEQA